MLGSGLSQLYVVAQARRRASDLTQTGKSRETRVWSALELYGYIAELRRYQRHKDGVCDPDLQAARASPPSRVQHQQLQFQPGLCLGLHYAGRRVPRSMPWPVLACAVCDYVSTVFMMLSGHIFHMHMAYL